MKAIVCERYGGPEVLMLADIPQPQPKAGEVLIRVQCTGLNAGDWHLMRADPWLVRLMFGLFSPKHKVLGSAVSGLVESVGEGVSEFTVGDEVLADCFPCGLGGFAEFATAKVGDVVHKPEELTWAEAAGLPIAAVTALQALRDSAKLEAGQRVLIHGASGGVGAFAMQIARAMGAEVDGVCSGPSVEFVRSLGAGRVFNYTKEDFTRSGEKYDVIIGVGGGRKLKEFREAMTPTGIFVHTGGENSLFYETMLKGSWMSSKKGQRLVSFLMKSKGADLGEVLRLVAQGALRVHIDRRFPLEQCADAVRHLEKGKPKGRVVLEVGESAAKE